jgi:hypothetical protein
MPRGLVNCRIKKRLHPSRLRPVGPASPDANAPDGNSSGIAGSADHSSSLLSCPHHTIPTPVVVKRILAQHLEISGDSMVEPLADCTMFPKSRGPILPPDTEDRLPLRRGLPR